MEVEAKQWPIVWKHRIDKDGTPFTSVPFCYLSASMEFVEIWTETTKKKVRFTIWSKSSVNGWKHSIYYILFRFWHQTIRQWPMHRAWVVCNWIYYVACFMRDTMPSHYWKSAYLAKQRWLSFFMLTLLHAAILYVRHIKVHIKTAAKRTE